MMPKLKVQIFDLDGCISDDAWRKHHLPDYEVYHSMLLDDKIMNLRQLQAAYVSGCDIVIMTARPARFLEDTIAWLDKYNIEYHMLMMRDDNDKRSSVEVKFGMLKQLDHVIIDAAFDDREDVCRMYSSQGIDSFLLDERGIAERVVYSEPLTAADILESGAATHRAKNAEYKDANVLVGKIMELLFPNGVKLRTAAEFEKWHLFELLIVKLTRFVTSELEHQDSIHDLMIYAAMIESLLPKEKK